MKIKALLFIFLAGFISLPACAFDEVAYETTPMQVQAEQPVIIYSAGYGYGYWYQDVWYPAPDDFVYSEDAIIYWGPFVVEPVIYYRTSFGWGYWCDGFWYGAPYGFRYYRGCRPYWGPVYVYGRYNYRGHYCGAYSPPGVHRGGYFVHHPGSGHYVGSYPHRFPVPPLHVAPPRIYRPAPPYYHGGGGYGGPSHGGFHGGGGGHFGGGHGGHR